MWMQYSNGSDKPLPLASLQIVSCSISKTKQSNFKFKIIIPFATTWLHLLYSIVLTSNLTHQFTTKFYISLCKKSWRKFPLMFYPELKNIFSWSCNKFHNCVYIKPNVTQILKIFKLEFLSLWAEAFCALTLSAFFLLKMLYQGSLLSHFLVL